MLNTIIKKLEGEIRTKSEKKILTVISIATLSLTANAQWVQQTSGSVGFLRSSTFPTANVGYITQENGIILKTTNGGANWNSMGALSSAGPVPIFFTSIDTGYYSKYTGGGVLKTVDGGTTWVDNFPNYTCLVYSIHFPTITTGYALCGNATSDSVLIYKSINAGNSWTLVNSFNYYFPINNIFFTDASTGFVSLSDGLYKTTDGGSTWLLKLSSPFNYLNSVMFPSSSTGYVVGDSIYNSTDAGETWHSQTNANPGPYYSVFFTDNNNGYAAGGNGFSTGSIIKTTDGGANWTLSLGTTYTFNSVYFPNANTGYACGTGGVIFKINTSIGINETKENNALNMYPNPTTGQFTVDAEGGEIKEINIYDILGQQVNSQLASGNSESVDITGFSAGVYFLKMEIGNEIITRKVIILKE